MAEPFDEALPTVGQKPWSLNPAITEVRGRLGGVEDFVSGPGLQSAIQEAAENLPIAEVNDGILAEKIADPASATNASLVDQVENSASPVGSALTAKYADASASLVKARRRDVSATVNVDAHPSFFVNGVNWGPFNKKVNGAYPAASYTLAWTADWDEAVALLNVDRAADMGFNLLRIMGTYKAYSQDGAAYLGRVRKVFERARARSMKVLFCLLTDSIAGDELVGPSHYAGYQQYVSAIVGEYASDPLIYGWDVLNEWDNGNNGPATIADLQTIAGYVKAADPAAKVTASINSPVFSRAKSIRPFVDFYDVHVYKAVSTASFGMSSSLSDITAYFTDKPILVSESGANQTTTGYIPHLYNDWSHAAHYAAIRHYFTKTPTLAGLVFHKIADGTNQHYGLWNAADNTGQLRKSAQEAMQAPSSRPQIIHDIVDHRLHPIVVENFGRADSPSSLGASPIGGTPTPVTGTWGVEGLRGVVSAHSTSPARDVLVWEARTSTVMIEAEFIPGPACKAGIAFCVNPNANPDAMSFQTFMYDTTLAQPSIVGYEIVGGSSKVTTYAGADPLTSGFNARPVGSLDEYVKLAVVYSGGTYEFWVQGRLVQRVAAGYLGSQFTGYTKHGLYVGNADTGTKFTRVRVSTPGAAWP